MSSATAVACGAFVRRPARICTAAASHAACEATLTSSECGAPKIGGKRLSNSAIGSAMDMHTSYLCADDCGRIVPIVCPLVSRTLRERSEG
jgi:hypothetical protein